MIEEKEIIDYLKDDWGFNKDDIDGLMSIIKYYKLNKWEDIDCVVVSFNAGKESIKED